MTEGVAWPSVVHPGIVQEILNSVTPLIDLDRVREVLIEAGWRHSTTSQDVEVWRYEAAVLPRRYSPVLIPVTRGGWIWGEADEMLATAIRQIARVQDWSVRDVARRLCGMEPEAPLPGEPAVAVVEG